MKRLTQGLLVFLLLGTIVNVATAWVFVALPAPVIGNQGGTLGFSTIDTGDPRFPTHWFESREVVYRGVTRVVTLLREPSSPIINAPDVVTVLPPWVDPTPPGELRRWNLHLAAGWPKRALKCRFTQTSPTTFDTSGCVPLATASFEPWYQRGLPFVPIWNGLALNSLLFAAVLAVPFYTPIVVRRYVRIRRGRCPRCGYPVGESTRCSECGGPSRGRRRE